MGPSASRRDFYALLRPRWQRGIGSHMRPARRQCDGALVWQTRTKGVERGNAGAWLARIGVAYRVRSRAMLCGMPEEKKRIPWIAIVFAILALIAAFKASDRSYYEVMPMMDSIGVGSYRSAPTSAVYEESDVMMSLQGMIAPDYYRGREVS